MKTKFNHSKNKSKSSKKSKNACHTCWESTKSNSDNASSRSTASSSLNSSKKTKSLRFQVMETHDYNRSSHNMSCKWGKWKTHMMLQLADCTASSWKVPRKSIKTLTYSGHSSSRTLKQESQRQRKYLLKKILRSPNFKSKFKSFQIGWLKRRVKLKQCLLEKKRLKWQNKNCTNA